MGMPRLDSPKQLGNHLSAEVVWSLIHQVEVVKEVLLECVKSAVSPVPRWLRHFFMKGLDNLPIVNLNDSTAARCAGIEGEHG